MKYLEKTEELLFEPTFLPFAEIIYERFLSLDKQAWGEAIAIYDDITELTVKSWLSKCKSQTPTRIVADYSLAFRSFASLEVQKVIRGDWEKFEKGLKKVERNLKISTINNFLDEVASAKLETFRLKFLGPIQKSMIETFERIEEHYGDIERLSKKVEIRTGKAREQPRIQWNADNTLLYALLLDLKNQKLPNNRNCLSGSIGQIATLIANNFDDANGRRMVKSDILRWIGGKTPRHISKKIKIDVNDFVIVPNPKKKKK